MHLHTLARSVLLLVPISLVCHALDLSGDEHQSVLSQNVRQHVNVDRYEGVGHINILGAVHPIPPNRGNGSDQWNLSSFTNTTFHDFYHPLFEIDEFMEHLAAMYPDNVTIYELGHSGEGREMYAMRVSRGEQQDGDKPRIEKKAFVITGAQHAREWVASASTLYLAHALLSNSSEPNSLSHLLKHFDFHIIPVPNPDGYVFTWEDDRLWYKNRMPVGPSEPCLGLDMNRNWGYHWSPSEYPDPIHHVEEPFDTEDTEDFDSLTKKKKKKKKGKKGKKGRKKPVPADPCSHWYPGRRPFEAPEVNNIANYIMQTPALEAFLDLRNYGQMLSLPYSYSCDTLPADAEDLLEAALGAAHMVRRKHGTVYRTGSLCSTLYPAPGNILDWMYASAGVKYSYAVHLRDLGTYGYSLPREWIRPVGEETGTIVEYITRFITNPDQKYR